MGIIENLKKNSMGIVTLALVLVMGIILLVQLQGLDLVTADGYADNATDAFTRIANSGSKFFSRGDNSGTHIKELSIWETVPDPATDSWHIETGTGMSATLTLANEQEGYVLSDLGTYTQLHASNDLPNLDIHFDEDEQFYNPYSYMIVNPEMFSGDTERHPRNAQKYLDFLQSDTALDIVNNLVLGGIQLFNPVEEA